MPGAAGRPEHTGPMRPSIASLALLSLAGCCACGEDLPAPDVAPITSWVEASGPAPEAGRRLRVVSYNVKLLPVVDADDEAARARAIPAALDRRTDVAVLQEAYDADETRALLDGLAARGLRHATDPLDGGWGAFEGGVRVVSRWPIEAQAGLVFSCGVWPDALADKGVVYARVRRGGDRFHVFGAHLQSVRTALRPQRAARIQRAQLRRLSQFVEDQRLAPHEPVIIAGDLNLDLRTPEQLGLMLGSLDADLPPLDLTGGAFTYDGERNPLARSGVRRWVDYVLLRRGHAAPAWSRLRAVALPGLSDHFPVEGTFVFPPRAGPP